MRYFFSTANGSFHADPEGTELESIADAREQATRYAGEILRDNPKDLWVNNELTVTTTDKAGLVLFTITVLADNAAATLGSPHR